MTRRTGFLIVAAAALLIALPVGWYFGSPWWTLWRMREAARAGDVATLASYVDFEAVRADAKAQARSEVGSIFGGVRPSGPVGRALIALAARKVTDRAAAALISPEALRVWLANISPGSSGARRSSYEPTVEHHGLDAFDVHDARMPADGTRLTFRRTGLRWKLAAIRWGEQ